MDFDKSVSLLSLKHLSIGDTDCFPGNFNKLLMSLSQEVMLIPSPLEHSPVISFLELSTPSGYRGHKPAH